MLIPLFSCGLARYPTILPPEQIQAPGDILNEFEFLHDPENDPDIFLGYELYYKFYTDLSNIENETYNEDTAYIENNAVFGSNVPNILQARSYFRITSPEVQAEAKPLIRFSLAQETEQTKVTVSFEPNPDYNPEEAYAFWGETDVITIQRSVSGTAGNFEPFLNEYYDADDADIPEDYDPVNPDLSIALYAVSYGIDTTEFRSFYSEPLLLGKLEL
ncbi:MAG: hypothetical protein ACLFSE_00925 [Spirochaetia bacterium]